jgi:hypothetical protein
LRSLWSDVGRPDRSRQHLLQRHLATGGGADVQGHRQARVDVATDDPAHVATVYADAVGELLDGDFFLV